MAVITSVQSNSESIANTAVGSFATDSASAAAATITLGFTPRYFRLVNMTDRITDEWFEGLASASSLHMVANGTNTAETTNGIAVSGSSVTFTATTLVASKSYYWIAHG